jgi:3-phosphoshikimate 1-carboxyvinyltransferase
LGARVDYLGEPGYPPLKVFGTGLKGGRTSIDGTLSSQFLTSLLLSAPLAADPVEIQIVGELVSRPYIDITLDLMSRFGVRVDHHNYRQFQVPTGGYTTPGEYLVEGDASSATYFLAAGAISGPGVTVTGIGSDSVQGDVRFVDVLARMGARVDKQADRLTVRPGPLKGIVADLNDITDAAMTIAMVALFADGPTEIRNIYNWRVKETDRLSAMATELRKLGATIVEGRDFIRITPPDQLHSAAIDTYGDHRMAMCFSLAALAGVSIQINNPECVAKTFPDYFQVFRSLAA